MSFLNSVYTVGLELEATVIRSRKPVVCDFLPYTKKAPLVAGSGTLLHKDASMLELAMPPTTTGRELDRVYDTALKEAEALLPDGATLSLQAGAVYSDEELAKDEYASEMGCSPSQHLYAYPEGTPSEYQNNLRYGGMHVNLGLNDYHLGVNSEMVYLMDIVLGLASVIECEQEEKDMIIERRKVYGRAGEYRVKQFKMLDCFNETREGIEYRTLPASTWKHWNGSVLRNKLGDVLAHYNSAHSLFPLYKDVQNSINNCDAELAASTAHEVNKILRRTICPSV